ncbi:hypothetical protein, partial [Burkholderia ubonensis]|uniref:hypothetical protein n=1 Tax=Burkholderia ubonensis TaxID=101571 RepID=UPI001E5C1E28
MRRIPRDARAGSIFHPNEAIRCPKFGVSPPNGFHERRACRAPAPVPHWNPIRAQLAAKPH